MELPTDIYFRQVAFVGVQVTFAKKQRKNVFSLGASKEEIVAAVLERQFIFLECDMLRMQPPACTLNLKGSMRNKPNWLQSFSAVVVTV